MKRIAINGLGRIGRLVLRHYMASERKDIEIVAANDLVPPEDLAYLIKYDSVHRSVPYEVSYGDDFVQLGQRKIRIFAEKAPEKLPWKELAVDVVIECTGRFTDNDLTQLTLGVDRDSQIMAFDYDERDPGVMKMIQMAVERCKRNERHSGICGQAPSDYLEVAAYLVKIGIDSMSLNPDSVLKTIQDVDRLEAQLGRR